MKCEHLYFIIHTHIYIYRYLGFWLADRQEEKAGDFATAKGWIDRATAES
jgi:hypothetical protein